jgi:glycosyltransferase involved in cell wall biosynthesis
MKLGWLTPLGPRSDIGTFSRTILSAAAESGRLDVVPIVNENGPTYFHPGPMLRLHGAFDEEVLQGFDLLVHNIGNNVENHGHINRLAFRYPGIVVVHDLVMQHYLAWEIFERLRDPAIYAELLALHYGPAGLDAVAASRICAAGTRPRYAPWDSGRAPSMPLIEPFIRAASAVIVHSAFAEDAVRPLTQGPILRLALPHDQKPALSEAEIAAWAEATRRRDRMTFAAFGHINVSKCLRLLIEAFAEEPELRDSARLVIAGYPSDEHHAAELGNLVRELNLEASVRIELAVSVERLQELKRETDVFVNLRWPNTESASGSLVEQLNTGKPVLVYASGCYAEVPANAVFRVSPVNSVSALATSMLAAARDAEGRIRVGAAGRDHARGMSSARYVAGLADFVAEHATLLRARHATHHRLRARGADRLAGRVEAAGTSWARDLAVARETLAPIFEGAAAGSLLALSANEPRLLRDFVLLGLFRQPDVTATPLLAARLDALMAEVSPLRLQRVLRQVAAVRRLADSGSLAGVEALRDPDPRSFELLAAQGPDHLAQALYPLVLCRPPMPGEADGYAARLACGEAVSSIAREMMASEEFAGRDVTPAARERILEGAALASELLRRSPEQAPELAAGRPLNLRSAGQPPADLLLGQWHGPETEGIWSGAAVTRIAFRLPPDLRPGQAVGVHARLPVPPDSPPRAARILLNDRVERTLEVDVDGWQDIVVPLPRQLRGGEVVTLAIDMGSTVIAAAFGDPLDQRRLGILLAEVALVDEGQAPTADVPELPAPAALDFASPALPAAIFAAGWHPPEPDGIWTEGPAGEIRFRTPRGAAGELLLLLEAPVTPPGVSCRLSATLDGEGASASVMPPARTAELRLKLGATPDGVHELRLESEHVFRPIDVTRSPDDRLLGLRVIGFELLPAPAAENAGGPTP